MFSAHVILFALVLVIASDALSIRTLTENVNDPKVKASEFFPDWVPFKNKRGEDLGEFVQVPKAKLKKRLALPVNFILRAVAEPEGDDYFDKGQGESDNEEYYEKKYWSDTQRAPQHATVVEAGASTNHTEISDIDGVVDIITKRPATPIAEAIHNFIKSNVDSKRKVEKEDSDEVETKDGNSAEENENEEGKKEDTTTKSDDDTDYDETSSENPKPDDRDQTESEAKKTKILSSVDELKVRHAEEQRLISEKMKEEEMFKEERDRENMQRSDEADKYTSKRKLNRIEPDYEEYDGTNSSSDEKYHFNTQRMSTRTTSTSTAATPPQRTAKHKGKNKTIETGKLSVFKNPHLYMLEDEDDTETVTTVRPTHTQPVTNDITQRFSAKYRATPAEPEESDEIERISLLPENDTNSEEPTLFFPKKTKKNKRRKTTTSALVTDSSVAESVPDGTAKQLSTSTQGAVVSEAAASSPEHPGGAPADAIPASTQHDKQQNKIEDYENERGGGRDYHAQHEEEHDEHGKKAYEVRNPKRRDKKLSIKSVASLKTKPWYLHYAVDGHHEDTKTEKGHHDKENHHGEYDDQGGVKEEHHDSSQHYGSHHHEEHGKKHAKYEESGKHSKGHSTKGSHDIHKKEEYEKKVEFFEEEGDSGEEEKHGGHNHEREHNEGGHYKKGDLQAGYHEHAKGDSGHSIKGGHQHGHKGHAQSAGRDGHGKREHREQHKAGRASGTKWVYHHGHPAKTANLVPVDRRTDKYSHGPYYYG